MFTGLDADSWRNKKQLLKIVIEKGALTCCQSVSVCAVIDVNARYVVCYMAMINGSTSR